MKLEGSRSWNNPIYSKLYSIWKSMKSRCYNENDTSKYKIPSYSIQRSIREGKTTKNGWKFELIQEGYYLLD